LWLSISAGVARGRLIAVISPNFLIGRDPSCNLRLGSPMVSKLHAALIRRDSTVFLRDLGSTNGTILNGRPIRRSEVAVHHGDRIQIGPIIATLLTGPQQPDLDQVEDQVAAWLGSEHDKDQSQQFGRDDTLTLPTPAEDEPDAGGGPEIRSEVIQDTVVVTPRASTLDDPETVEQLRCHLRAHFDSSAPREVVVNLEYAGHLSAQAIGVLLAHHVRLDQVGGCMRICQARARVMAVLHQVRLTVLMACYPTLDEAVLDAWPGKLQRPHQSGSSSSSS
jgi:anti-anti-sigma factor